MYPQPNLWALALGAVLTEQNQSRHDMLGGGKAPAWCRDVLVDSYGIEDFDSFREMVVWLATEGHSAEARETIASLGPSPLQDTPKQSIARAYRAQIERQGLLAWDAGRLASVIGWAVCGGMVGEADGWKMLLATAVRVQRTYISWREFGDAYLMGRMYWSQGARSEKVVMAYTNLLGNPMSPWNRLPWKTELGQHDWDPSSLRPKARFKRSVCPSCGGHKTRPSLTAYVYCDFCGALADYDFQKACEKPAQKPGPVYENLHAQLAPMLAHAKMRGDVNAFRQLQMQLFDSFVVVTPASCPPRVSDPRYRQAYVAYMAEGAVVSAFDQIAQQHEALVNRVVQGLQFASPKPGVIKVAPHSFHPMAEAVFAQQDHLFRLYSARGVYAMHPDRAAPELQKRIGISLFVQGWLPMLDEQTTQGFLERAGFKSEYVEADPPPGAKADCAACGNHLEILPGARRIVCEKCGQGLEVGGDRLTCRGCGSALAPAEGTTNVTCPHCRQSFQRVRQNL